MGAYKDYISLRLNEDHWFSPVHHCTTHTTPVCIAFQEVCRLSLSGNIAPISISLLGDTTRQHTRVREAVPHTGSHLKIEFFDPPTTGKSYILYVFMHTKYFHITSVRSASSEEC